MKPCPVFINFCTQRLNEEDQKNQVSILASSREKQLNYYSISSSVLTSSPVSRLYFSSIRSSVFFFCWHCIPLSEKPCNEAIWCIKVLDEFSIEQIYRVDHTIRLLLFRPSHLNFYLLYLPTVSPDITLLSEPLFSLLFYLVDCRETSINCFCYHPFFHFSPVFAQQKQRNLQIRPNGPKIGLRVLLCLYFKILRVLAGVF